MYQPALLLLKTRERQGTYKVHQIETQQCPTITSFAQQKSREPIDVTVGDAFHISGWIDTPTSETMITVQIAGHDLGVFHGMASQTLCIDLHLHFVQGYITLELNAFDELWVHVDTKRGETTERLAFFDCKKSEQVKRVPGIVCESWC